MTRFLDVILALAYPAAGIILFIFMITGSINADTIAKVVAYAGIGSSLLLFFIIAPARLTPQYFPQWLLRTRQGTGDTLSSSFYPLASVVGMLLASSSFIAYFLLTPFGEFPNKIAHYMALLCSLFIVPFCLWQLLIESTFKSSLIVNSQGLTVEIGTGTAFTISRDKFVSAVAEPSKISPHITIISKGNVEIYGYFPDGTTRRNSNVIRIRGELIGRASPVSMAEEIERRLRNT